MAPRNSSEQRLSADFETAPREARANEKHRRKKFYKKGEACHATRLPSLQPLKIHGRYVGTRTAAYVAVRRHVLSRPVAFFRVRLESSRIYPCGMVA